MNKPFHPSTNHDILVKIGPLESEIPGLENEPLKIKKKNIGKIYSPSASLLSELN